MTRVAIAALLCATLVGCGSVVPSSSAAARTRAGDARSGGSNPTLDERLDSLEARARRLSASWAEVEAYWRRSEEAHRLARQRWDEATVRFERSSESYRRAREAWERARTAWEFATYLVEVAAMIDAANLEAVRARGWRGVERADLAGCEPVSTQTFRRRLEAQGQDIRGFDVDHIVPRALGGPDHPLNYQLLPAGTNRSLGADFGPAKCWLVGLLRCAAAVAVSRRCGSFRGAMPF